MKKMKTLTVNGVTYEVDDPNAAGEQTEEGGAVFGDYAWLQAVRNAAAFGGRIDRSGGNGDPTQESLDTNPDLWRHSEASQPGAIAGGLGAYALARASKSLGYRTQTGYALKKHLKETTFQTKDGEVTAVDPSVVPYVLKDGSYAETYEQIIAEKGSLPGQGSVAIGSDTAVVANNAFVGGYKSRVFANNAFGFGSKVYVRRIGGTGFGYDVEVNNYCGFAAGDGLKTVNRDAQAVLGSYNAYADDVIKDALLVLGNGIDEQHRSNAMVVRENGDAEFSGKLHADGEEVSLQSFIDQTFPSFTEMAKVVECNPVTGSRMEIVSQIPHSDDGYKNLTLHYGRNLNPDVPFNSITKEITMTFDKKDILLHGSSANNVAQDRVKIFTLPAGRYKFYGFYDSGSTDRNSIAYFGLKEIDPVTNTTDWLAVKSVNTKTNLDKEFILDHEATVCTAVMCKGNFENYRFHIAIVPVGGYTFETVFLDTTITGGTMNWTTGVLNAENGERYQLEVPNRKALSGTNMIRCYAGNGISTESTVSGKLDLTYLIADLQEQVNKLQTAVLNNA